MRISKIIVETFWKLNSYVFYYFLMKWWVGFKSHRQKNLKNLIFIYPIILWWNSVRISESLMKNLKKVHFLCILFVMKWCEDFKYHCRKLWKILNHLFYYFVMKWCEDFKIHCWKFWKISILMYSIILWWNDVRISKIIVEKKCEKF